MRSFFYLLLSGFVFPGFIHAQNGYWQQEVDYKMNIDFDHTQHQFKGTQRLIYTNHSPDTLHQVFYHLYYNAFQPGSMMDVRSRTIADPDPRVNDRIWKLKPDEIGYQKIESLTQDGKAISYEVIGTILEVKLRKPLHPGSKTTFDMVFNSQVPVQIRRTGRNNREGVDYSMSQWYPKLCEYDKDGWHANPYIGREFHGVWGRFDVTINIHRSYLIGGTGILQNPQEIGHGYEDRSKPVKIPSGDVLSWNFKAENVHDFVWAADPDFVHDQVKAPNGPMLHLIYQSDTLVNNWKKLAPMAVKCFSIMNQTFGRYPYSDYSIIQGGDGGMEYPMATLISGHGSFNSLVSVTVHEAIHSWFQGVLATNESKFPWMDEGFTTFAQYYVLDKIYERNASNPYRRAYRSYLSLARSDHQEPLTTHSDHFEHNHTYSISSYNKGAVCVAQLSYIMGEKTFLKGMLRYFNEWKFKHPTANDFKRVMEKVSGMELDWYFENWIGTTYTIDYGIRHVVAKPGRTEVTLERKGNMPMPVEVTVQLTDGTHEVYYIPLRLMRGEKPDAAFSVAPKQKPDWPWVYPEYLLVIDRPVDEIEQIIIDADGRMADTFSDDNVWPWRKDLKFRE